MCQQAAEQRAQRKEHHRDAAVDTHRLAPLSDVERVDDHRPGRRDHHRGADSLETARGDDHGLVLGKAAERRGDHEQAGSGTEGALGADQIGYAAAQGDQNRQ